MDWYIVEVEHTQLSRWRIKATDPDDAMARCFEDGQEIKTMDVTFSEAIGARKEALDDGKGNNRA